MTTWAKVSELLSKSDWAETLPAEYTCFECGKARVKRLAEYCDGCKVSRVKREQREQILKAIETIPEKHRHTTLLHPQLVHWVRSREAIERARACIGKMVVLLVGPKGAGKTPLASAMLLDVVRKGIADDATSRERNIASRVMFVHAYEIPKARSQHPLGEGEPPLIAKALRASVLVLDELQPFRDDRNDLYELLHAREAAKRATIITTFMTRDDIARAWDGGLVKRIWDEAERIELGSNVAVRLAK